MSQFVIDKTEPGSVLQDFHSLLDFIGPSGQLVSKKQMVLSPKIQAELNHRLTQPIVQKKQRPTPKTFPHVTVLYLCAKWLGFFYFTNEGSKKRVNLNAQAVEKWQERNVTEQYFALLEAWLFGDPNDYRSLRPPVNSLDWFRARCLSKSRDYYHTIFDKEYKIDTLLAGLELFGLVTIEHAVPEEGEGWKINSVIMTQFGQFVTELLGQSKSMDNDVFFDRLWGGSKEQKMPVLPAIFRPHFPDLITPYQQFRETLERRGTFIFKVLLGKTWRRIAIVDHADLDELASVILDAFGFDNDHLYLFDFISMSGIELRYVHPAADEENFTDEIQLCELPLPIQSSMSFVFDFGQWWKFEVLLEKINGDYELDFSEIISSEGVAPDQYPDWPEG